MSGIPHSCFGCVSQEYSLWTVKLMLSKTKIWLKKVDSQLARLQDLICGNQETRQLELWNLAQWEIFLIVPGKVLWRKCIWGLGAKTNRALMWNHCRSLSPLSRFPLRHIEAVFTGESYYFKYIRMKNTPSSKQACFVGCARADPSNCNFINGQNQPMQKKIMQLFNQ